MTLVAKEMILRSLERPERTASRAKAAGGWHVGVEHENPGLRQRAWSVPMRMYLSPEAIAAFSVIGVGDGEASMRFHTVTDHREPSTYGTGTPTGDLCGAAVHRNQLLTTVCVPAHLVLIATSSALSLSSCSAVLWRIQSAPAASAAALCHRCAAIDSPSPVVASSSVESTQ